MPVRLMGGTPMLRRLALFNGSLGVQGADRQADVKSSSLAGVVGPPPVHSVMFL